MTDTFLLFLFSPISGPGLKLDKMNCFLLHLVGNHIVVTPNCKNTYINAKYFSNVVNINPCHLTVIWSQLFTVSVCLLSLGHMDWRYEEWVGAKWPAFKEYFHVLPQSWPRTNFVLWQSENFLGLERNDYFMPRPPSILVGSDLCYVSDISIKVLMK